MMVGVLLAACPRPVTPEACRPASSGGTGGFGAGGGTGSSIEGFRVQGDIITLTMFIAMVCPSEVSPTATVSVQDPNNDTVALLEGESMRAVERRDAFGMTTVVKVRADLPGPYHFTARFEPNLGIAQRDVLVAENHRDAGPEVVVPAGSMLSSCPHIDVTEDGRLLCLAQSVRVFDRAGLVQQTLTTSGVAARAGRVLWVRNSTQLERWLETDAGFERDSDGGLVVPNGAVLAAEEESVLAAGSFEVMMVRHSAAGALVGQVDPNLVANNPVGVWKRGEEYVVLGDTGISTTLCTGRFRDAGTCMPLIGGPEQQPRAVASEPAGLWTAADDFNSPPITTLQLRTPALREFVLPSGWSLGSGPIGWDTGVRLTHTNGDTLFPGDRSGTYVLQAFPSETVKSVTSRWVTQQRSNGDLVIYRR